MTGTHHAAYGAAYALYDLAYTCGLAAAPVAGGATARLAGAPVAAGVIVAVPAVVTGLSRRSRRTAART